MANPFRTYQGRRTYIFCAVLGLYSLGTLFRIIPDGGTFATGNAGSITSGFGAIIGTTLRLTLANMLLEFRERQQRIETKLDELLARGQPDV